MKVTIPTAPTTPTKMSRRAAAARLGLSDHATKRLQLAGLLPDPLTRAAVDTLADRFQVESDGEAIPMIRLDSADTDWLDGRKIGYHAAYTDDELLNASRKRWATTLSRALLEAPATLLVVSGFIIGSISIDDIEHVSSYESERTGKDVACYEFHAHLITRIRDLANLETVAILDPAHPSATTMASITGHRAPRPGGGAICMMP